ncbi:MAG: hypothetical protein J1D88_08145 [Treponema sp.]|nr:hypothetical protein [Treponema sp.]
MIFLKFDNWVMIKEAFRRCRVCCSYKVLQSRGHTLHFAQGGGICTLSTRINTSDAEAKYVPFLHKSEKARNGFAVDKHAIENKAIVTYN